MLEQATRPAARMPSPAISQPERYSASPATQVRAYPGRQSRGLTFAAPSFPARPRDAFAKRTIDLGIAIPALILLGPLMLLVALAIRVDSPGPILIGQERVSKGLTRFRMFKFRSMVPNANELVGSLQALNEATPPLFKIRNDPRVTRLGRHLRRLSIDELPQLINVLRGEMSVVGPRPPLVHEVEFDRWRQAARLRQAPGMTGLWQVSGRSNLGYEAMIALDLHYVRNWSIPLDLAILMRTPLAVLRGKGAH